MQQCAAISEMDGGIWPDLGEMRYRIEYRAPNGANKALLTMHTEQKIDDGPQNFRFVCIYLDNSFLRALHLMDVQFWPPGKEIYRNRKHLECTLIDFNRRQVSVFFLPREV